MEHVEHVIHIEQVEHIEQVAHVEHRTNRAQRKSKSTVMFIKPLTIYMYLGLNSIRNVEDLHYSAMQI